MPVCKKLSSLLLTLLLLLAFLTACGEQAPTASSFSEESPSSSPSSFSEEAFSPGPSPSLASPAPAQSSPESRPPESSSLQARPQEASSSPSPGVEAPSLEAKQAILFDMASGNTLFLKGNSHERIYPASVTKLFTAYTALKYLNADRIITAGEELNLLEEGSSIAYILKGHRLSAEMLVEAMLLPSGNDAAYILATAAGREIRGDSTLSAQEAVSAFVYEMNLQAHSLGLYDTHFSNPDGYHEENHYSSLTDLVEIAKLALGNKIIAKYASLAEASVFYASGESNYWKNTNELLFPSSPYFRKEAVGLKTGHTEEAGYCLLSAVRSGSSYAIIGVFGCESPSGRFSDSCALIDSFFERNR